jgi:hypothetical protein
LGLGFGKNQHPYALKPAYGHLPENEAPSPNKRRLRWVIRIMLFYLPKSFSRSERVHVREAIAVWKVIQAGVALKDANCR